jgi:uncharacterized membrane protein YphA (DoxX/SURF4 family)
MPSTTRTMGTGFPAWPKYALRFTFGGIWLIDAVLKWLPGFRSSYMSSISGAGMGQPGWLQWWFHFWTNMQHPAPSFFAYLVAVLETLVALAVIFGVARKVSYFAAAGFSVVIWAVAEGFGGPYASGASDIGTAIIYALVFACLLTLAVYTGPDTFSVDHYLEKKISWWWKLAEFGRPVQAQPSIGGPVAREQLVSARLVEPVAAVFPVSLTAPEFPIVPVATPAVTPPPVSPDRPATVPAGRH